MSPYFANDMFDITKRQKDFSFHLDLFHFGATGRLLHIFKIRRISQASIFTVNG